MKHVHDRVMANRNFHSSSVENIPSFELIFFPPRKLKTICIAQTIMEQCQGSFYEALNYTLHVLQTRFHLDVTPHSKCNTMYQLRFKRYSISMESSNNSNNTTLEDFVHREAYYGLVVNFTEEKPFVR